MCGKCEKAVFYYFRSMERKQLFIKLLKGQHDVRTKMTRRLIYIKIIIAKKYKVYRSQLQIWINIKTFDLIESTFRCTRQLSFCLHYLWWRQQSTNGLLACCSGIGACLELYCTCGEGTTNETDGNSLNKFPLLYNA